MQTVGVGVPDGLDVFEVKEGIEVSCEFSCLMSIAVMIELVA